MTYIIYKTFNPQDFLRYLKDILKKMNSGRYLEDILLKYLKDVQPR